MKWYLSVLKNYVNFTNRSRRKEYWMFVLFHLIFAIIAMGLDLVLGFSFGAVNGIYGPIYIIYVLFLMIPSLAVLVRRLHDVGKSGAMIFVGLIPIIGSIWLFVLLVSDSEDGENRWGPNPKDEGGETFLYA